MKSTLFAVAALFAALPVSAAFVLDPTIYAREYCHCRFLGWGKPASVEHSVMKALQKGLPVEVMHEGKKIDADVLTAFQAAKFLCPEYD